MADGQHAFGFRPAPMSRLRPGEIVVDLFAGGGGASIALEQALGRGPDIAINHDRFAVGMHAANHPLTRHLCEDVWEADPRALIAGRSVGWLHASPDCTHFSQAKGGQPRSRATRSLSWVVLKWAGAVRPRIVSLENVTQIQKWGPLVAKRDRATGRVITLDTVSRIDPGTGEARMVNRVAGPGERVPIGNQFLIPDPRHAGRTWRHFLAALRRLGYTVEARALRACDYGAGTSRTRLFLIARRDGEPICWPTPTHGREWEPFVTAADCIDWKIPCPSIFERKKPLAAATCRRIARGIKRYVLEAAEPFIVQCANASASGVHASSDPLGTVTGWPKGGSYAVVAPTLIQAAHGEGSGPTRRRGSGAHDAQEPLGVVHAGGGSFALAAATLVQTGYGEREGQAPRALDLHQPLGTVVGGASKHALVTAFLEQANGGGPNGKPPRARAAWEPLSTITGTGTQQRVVTAHMAKLRGTSSAADVEEPLHTVSAGGEHHAVVECTLSPDAEAGALRVAAFLLRYYSEGGQWGELREPIDTITTRDRLALVTVTIRGTPYVIVDIGLRMLKPHELYRAQGFPADYIIDRTADGTPLTISQQVRMVGNSVSPPPLRALAEANLDAVIPQAAAA